MRCARCKHAERQSPRREVASVHTRAGVSACAPYVLLALQAEVNTAGITYPPEISAPPNPAFKPRRPGRDPGKDGPHAAGGPAVQEDPSQLSQGDGSSSEGSEGSEQEQDSGGRSGQGQAKRSKGQGVARKQEAPGRVQVPSGGPTGSIRTVGKGASQVRMLFLLAMYVLVSDCARLFSNRQFRGPASYAAASPCPVVQLSVRCLSTDA